MIGHPECFYQLPAVQGMHSDLNHNIRFSFFIIILSFTESILPVRTDKILTPNFENTFNARVLNHVIPNGLVFDRVLDPVRVFHWVFN